MTDKNKNKYSYFRSLGDGRFYLVSKIFDDKKDKQIKYRIGTDSLNIKDKSIYIISIIGIYPDNKGAFVYYQKQKFPKINNVQERLWKEVEISIEAACYFRNEYKLEIDKIEFDLNKNQNYLSSRLYSSALGWAESFGFQGSAKPDEIFAISVSDHLSHKHDGKEFFSKKKKNIKKKFQMENKNATI